MLSDEFRALALLLPEAEEGAHMGHPDFRVGRKIFATLWIDEERAVVKLEPEQQKVLTDAEPDVFTPVAGAWGRRGWTNVSLAGADEAMLRDALLKAWRNAAPKRLVAEYATLESRRRAAAPGR